MAGCKASNCFSHMLHHNKMPMEPHKRVVDKAGNLGKWLVLCKPLPARRAVRTVHDTATVAEAGGHVAV